MKYIYVLVLLFSPIFAFTQSTETDIETFLIPSQSSWKNKIKPINYLGMETYVNSGNLHKSDSTDLWANNSFTWELYYAASVPGYNWISFGGGLEVGGSIGYNENGTVYDRTGNESFYFVMQAFMNITPWFTLHANSDSRLEFRSRYTANFTNPVNGNYGHFLLTEFIFGFFLAGNQMNPDIEGKIDEFWISSPSIEFLYYVQFHKNVAFRWFSKFIVNNGLFYDSDVSNSEAIPMEHYARLDFILGNGITLWTRLQWNIYNSDFNEGALFLNNNPFDIQIRAGLIFILDFSQKSTKNT